MFEDTGNAEKYAKQLQSMTIKRRRRTNQEPTESDRILILSQMLLSLELSMLTAKDSHTHIMYRKILTEAMKKRLIESTGEAIVDAALDYLKTYVYSLETLTGRRIKFDNTNDKQTKPPKCSNKHSAEG